MKKTIITLQIILLQLTIFASDQIISFESGVNNSIWEAENGQELLGLMSPVYQSYSWLGFGHDDDFQFMALSSNRLILWDVLASTPGPSTPGPGKSE